MLILIVLIGVAVGAALLAYTFGQLSPQHGAPALGPELIRSELARHSALRRLARRRLEPARATGLALTLAALVAVCGAISLGALFLMARHHQALARWDESLARFGARHATPTTTDVLRWVTWFGGTTGVLASSAAVAAVEYRFAERFRAAVAFLVVVIGGQFALANLIKLAVDRARPTLGQLTGFSGASFPSGHATAAAATYLALALLLGRGRSVRLRALLAAVAAGLAVAVAATRVLLGVHWLTDVLAGLALGWSWFALCSIAFGGRLLRFGAPVVTAEALASLPDRAVGQRPSGGRMG